MPRPGRAVTPTRLGLFGGSFDPVHRGHLAAARAAADDLALDEVWFIPARQQPLKHRGHVASPDHRLAMLRAALRDEPRFRVDARELARPAPSYTVDTLRAIRTERPSDSLFLLVGADSAADLAGWRESSAIPALANVVVLTRPGVDVPDHPMISRALSVPAVDVSASGVRARCGRGETIVDAVPAAVADYIARHGLYVEED
ncbi:MAG TPA: nicotinate-nucleotide adenylyltransferase [Gemmatimonadales bacterium]